jgi:hypothetical protein
MASKIVLLVKTITLFCILVVVQALDVSWIPSDGEGDGNYFSATHPIFFEKAA